MTTKRADHDRRHHSRWHRARRALAATLAVAGLTAGFGPALPSAADEADAPVRLDLAAQHSLLAPEGESVPRVQSVLWDQEHDIAYVGGAGRTRSVDLTTGQYTGWQWQTTALDTFEGRWGFHPNGTELFSTLGGGGTVRVFDLATGNLVKGRSITPVAGALTKTGLQFTGDDQIWVFFGNEGLIGVYDEVAWRASGSSAIPASDVIDLTALEGLPAGVSRFANAVRSLDDETLYLLAYAGPDATAAAHIVALDVATRTVTASVPVNGADLPAGTAAAHRVDIDPASGDLYVTGRVDASGDGQLGRLVVVDGDTLAVSSTVGRFGAADVDTRIGFGAGRVVVAQLGGEVDLFDADATRLTPVPAQVHDDIETEGNVVGAGIARDGSVWVALGLPSGQPVDQHFAVYQAVPVGPGPDSKAQTLTVEVPEPGPGEFAWSIDGTGPIDLGTPANAGDHWAFTGNIHPIVVTDTRTGGQPWSLSGQVGDFTGGLAGKHLGWTPQVTSPGAGATPGDPVASGFTGGNGLTVASTLAAADTGHAQGTATLGAHLDLQVPIATPPGTYTTTLTLTALS
ncbi:MAG: YncE family protein [Acidimicrobiia bacterium]